MPCCFDAESYPHATVPGATFAEHSRAIFMSIPLAGLSALLLILTIDAGVPVDPSKVTISEAVPVVGLADAVRIDLDALGTPSIHADHRNDAYAALGFMHARDRLVQMDLTRRSVAGELAALIGPAMVGADRTPALRRRRAIAERIVTELPADERSLLEHYTRGVNAAVATMDPPPAEYRLLNIRPEAWRPSDSVLVMLALFDTLQRSANREPNVGLLRETVPAEVAAWLLSVQGRWDALLIDPTDAEFIPDPPATGRPVPDDGQAWLADPPAPDLRPGSNSFAVAGTRTSDGRAILANDPHLRYSTPGIWYPAALAWDQIELVGITIPGVPGFPIGSTESIAWGLTNTTGDFEDLVLIDVDPEDSDRYRVPGGWEAFDVRPVEITVRGADPVVIESRWTRWGPVLENTPWSDRPVSLLRVSDQPGAVNLGLVDLGGVDDVESALDVAARWYGPSQNVLVADRDGRIGWTLSGWLPDRRGYDGRSPVTHDATTGWFGPLPEADRPRVVDPESGFLFTANNRLVPLESAARLGSNWADGGRAWRIRQDLAATQPASELDLLAIQLDETIQRFVPYRRLLIETLESMPAEPDRDATLQIVRAWDGCATAESLAVPVIEAFRRAAIRRTRAAIFDRVTSEVDIDDSRRRTAASAIGPNICLATLERRFPSLLPDDLDSWDELLRDAAAKAIDAYVEDPDTPWSERNRGVFPNPLGAVNPLIGDRFDLPSVPQAGHWGAVRVQSGSFGASARMIVSPSDRSKAILTVPGGQSGDPRSPHFADRHAAWAAGTPSPLLPGPPTNVIDLVPTSP
jgi:penicillin amidase